MFRNKKHIENQKYLIGGIDEISNFIAKAHCLNISIVKKQLIKKRFIVVTNLNDFDAFDGNGGFEQIIKSLATNVIGEGRDYDYNYINESIKSTHLPFGENTHYDEDNNVSAKKMIQMSSLQDEEKVEILKAIDDFRIEFDIVEDIQSRFDYESTYDLLKIVEYVKDTDIEQELRLTVLSKYMTKLNKAIINNNEIIKRKSLSHKKDFATIINNVLIDVLKTVKTELKQYLDLLSNEYQNISDDRQPREFLLHSLIENSQKMALFLKYERVLFEKKYISKDLSNWLKSPIELVKFYRFCEVNKIFRLHFEKNSKGVKLLRELYNFNEGTTIDKPTKRKIYTQVKQDYFFLNHIN